MALRLQLCVLRVLRVCVCALPMAEVPTPEVVAQAAVDAASCRVHASEEVAGVTQPPLCARPTAVASDTALPIVARVDVRHCGEAAPEVAAAAAAYIDAHERVTATAEDPYVIVKFRDIEDVRGDKAWTLALDALDGVPGAQPVSLPVKPVYAAVEWENGVAAAAAPPPFTVGYCFEVKAGPPVYRCLPPALETPLDLAVRLAGELARDSTVAYVHRRGTSLWLQIAPAAAAPAVEKAVMDLVAAHQADMAALAAKRESAEEGEDPEWAGEEPPVPARLLERGANAVSVGEDAEQVLHLLLSNSPQLAEVWAGVRAKAQAGTGPKAGAKARARAKKARAKARAKARSRAAALGEEAAAPGVGAGAGAGACAGAGAGACAGTGAGAGACAGAGAGAGTGAGAGAGAGSGAEVAAKANASSTAGPSDSADSDPDIDTSAAGLPPLPPAPTHHVTVVTVQAALGYGKSHTLAQVLHLLNTKYRNGSAPLFRSGVFSFSMASMVALQGSARVNALSIPSVKSRMWEDQAREPLALLRAWLQHEERQPWLLLVQNVDNTRALSSLLRELLPRPDSGCRQVGHVLVTTHITEAEVRAAMTDTLLHSIGPLTMDLGMQLLQGVAGVYATAPHEIAAMKEFLASSGCRNAPLAVTLAGAAVGGATNRSFLAYLKALHSMWDKLIEVVPVGTEHVCAASTYWLSFELLTADELLVIRIIAVAGTEPVPLHLVADTLTRLGCTASLSRLVGKAASLHLVRLHGDPPEAASMHQLLRLGFRVVYPDTADTVDAFTQTVADAVPDEFPLNCVSSDAWKWLPVMAAVESLVRGPTGGASVVTPAVASTAGAKVMLRGSRALLVLGLASLSEAWLSRIDALDLDPAMTMDVESQRAELHLLTGRKTEALELQLLALDKRQAAGPESSKAIGNGLRQVGFMLHHSGRHSEALVILSKALTVFHEEKDKSLVDPKDVCAATFLMAKVLECTGQFDLALPLFEETLSRRLKYLPDDYQLNATVLHNIGAVYAAQRRRQEALDHYRRALVLLRKCVPAVHPEVAATLCNMGSVLNGLGMRTEGLTVQREALALQRRLLPGVHPNLTMSLFNIATALHDLRRFEEALEKHVEVLDMRRECLPAVHWDVAGSLNNVGMLLSDLALLPEAEQCLKAAFAVHLRCLPSGHPDVATTQNGLKIIRTRIAAGSGRPSTRARLRRKRMHGLLTAVSEHAKYFAAAAAAAATVVGNMR